MDLKGWKYISDFGFTSAVYGKGDERVVVDKESSEIVVEYRMSVRGVSNG